MVTERERYVTEGSRGHALCLKTVDTDIRVIYSFGVPRGGPRTRGQHVVTQHRQTPATTHISRLAIDFTIQMVNPYDLKNACDLSTDLHQDGYEHLSMDTDFVVLLQRKYENCTDWFLMNLEALGVQEPLVVIILPDGRWQFDDGHHRLAWALLNNLDVPVVFDDSMVEGDDVLDNAMGYHVARPDVEARSYTTADADELIIETETYLTNVADAVTDEFMVIPRPRGSHREKAKTGGRHRAA